jgi:hypothetical protein
VEIFVELASDGLDYGLLAVTSVGATDASGEVDVAVAVYVFEPCVFCLRYVDRRTVGKAAGHGLSAAGRELAGFRARDLGVDANCAHINFSCELPEPPAAV